MIIETIILVLGKKLSALAILIFISGLPLEGVACLAPARAFLLIRNCTALRMLRRCMLGVIVCFITNISQFCTDNVTIAIEYLHSTCHSSIFPRGFYAHIELGWSLPRTRAYIYLCICRKLSSMEHQYSYRKSVSSDCSKQYEFNNYTNGELSSV